MRPKYFILRLLTLKRSVLFRSTHFSTVCLAKLHNFMNIISMQSNIAAIALSGFCSGRIRLQISSHIRFWAGFKKIKSDTSLTVSSSPSTELAIVTLCTGTERGWYNDRHSRQDPYHRREERMETENSHHISSGR